MFPKEFKPDINLINIHPKDYISVLYVNSSLFINSGGIIYEATLYDIFF
jgi:hypothetical protein